MLKALYERLNVKVKSVHSCKNKKGVFKHVYFLCTFFYLSDSLINKHVKFIAALGLASFWPWWGAGKGGAFDWVTECPDLPSLRWFPYLGWPPLSGDVFWIKGLCFCLPISSNRRLVVSKPDYNKIKAFGPVFAPLYLKAETGFVYSVLRFSWEIL